MHERQPSPRATAEGTILVADDYQPFRDSLRRVFKPVSNVSLLLAVNGEQALELARQYLPDLVTLDLGLDDEWGLDLVPHVRAAAPSALVAVISGHYRSEDVLAARNLRTVLLPKPVSLHTFLTLLEESRRGTVETLEASDPDETIESLQQRAMDRALRRHDGNFAAAASQLGISERKLREWARAMGWKRK
jgi:two-component system, response regulator RegA